MTSASSSPATATRIGSVRWGIAFLVSTAIAISYLDRQTLPVAIAAIRKEIPVTDGQFANLNVAFLVTYALMYAGGGRLMDLLGTRRGFTLIMVFWSLACASHGLASTLVMLAGSRLLLGIGEGGGFPAATRAMAEWFPVKERSVAMGIMNGGTAIGGIAAPPFIALVLVYYQLNWRWVFFISGAMGLLWTLWWRREYFPPEQHPRLSEAERVMIQSGTVANEADASVKVRWLDLLKFRQTWGVVVAKFFSDAAWYFYLLWLPKYLYDARHLNIKEVGYYAWIPHAAAGVGCLVGGALSAWLLKRQCSVNVARKVALGASAALMPLVFFIPSVPVGWVILFFSIAYFGQQSWSTLVMTLPADLFPKSAVGAVAGLVGFGGAMGGVCFLEGVGYMLDHHSGYGPVFAMAGTFHIVAFLIICIAVPNLKPLVISNNK
jgi:MFS transporter, ACS family, hexuronate transporter